MSSLNFPLTCTKTEKTKLREKNRFKIKADMSPAWQGSVTHIT